MDVLRCLLPGLRDPRSPSRGTRRRPVQGPIHGRKASPEKLPLDSEWPDLFAWPGTIYDVPNSIVLIIPPHFEVPSSGGTG